MKRNKLIKKLVKAGCYMKRHGGKHDIYVNPRNGRQSPVPRHSEIKGRGKGRGPRSKGRDLRAEVGRRSGEGNEFGREQEKVDSAWSWM